MHSEKLRCEDCAWYNIEVAVYTGATVAQVPQKTLGDWA